MTIDNDEFADLQAKNICSVCIGDSYLSTSVEKEAVSLCTYCGEELPCIKMEEFSDAIEVAFSTHFARTPEEPNSFEYAMLKDKEIDYVWAREGQTTCYAIMDAANIAEEIARDAQAILEYRHYDPHEAEVGVEGEFSEEAYYEEIMPNDDNVWHQQWDEFERLIKTEARFFSRTAAEHLRKLFDRIDEMRTYVGRSIVVEAGPDTDIASLYRGRVFQADDLLLEAMKRPDLHLAAPPTQFASAGRMNARGISVFYGATSPDIVLAEVRPPVGSKVTIARFEILRTLKLLDLTALHEIHERGSIFDPDYADRLGRMMFLRILSKKMARPVMPDDQEMEYLTTQAIADYLSTEGEVPLDGILFPSVQVGGKGLNVVLFHKVSRGKNLEIPEHTEIKARTYSMYEDGPEPDYSVTEEVSPGPVKEEDVSGEESDMFLEPIAWDLEDAFDTDTREITLRIDANSVKVHEVTAVQIETSSHRVIRHRFETTSLPF